MDNPNRRYRNDCLSEYQAEAVTTFSVAGPAALAMMRANGYDPAHRSDAGRKHGARIVAHAERRAQWARERASERMADADDFRRDILPLLRDVPVRTMARATGLTEGYCSFVRRGLKVPHRRLWRVPAELGTESRDEPDGSVSMGE